MVRQTPPFHVCVHILLALPSVLGEWSMVLMYGCNLSIIITKIIVPQSQSQFSSGELGNVRDSGS